MKTFVEVSMLTWETAAAGADGRTAMDVSDERVALGFDAPVSPNMDCTVRSDLDWMREHAGFDPSIATLGVPRA